MFDIRDLRTLPDEGRIAAVMAGMRLGRVQAIHHLKRCDNLAARLRGPRGGRW